MDPIWLERKRYGVYVYIEREIDYIYRERGREIMVVLAYRHKRWILGEGLSIYIYRERERER